MPALAVTVTHSDRALVESHSNHGWGCSFRLVRSKDFWVRLATILTTTVTIVEPATYVNYSARGAWFARNVCSSDDNGETWRSCDSLNQKPQALLASGQGRVYIATDSAIDRQMTRPTP